MRSIPSSRYYVYALARPDSSVFYVGKGCGYRMYDHEGMARRGHICYKCKVIRKIWRLGGEVQRLILLETDNEREALDFERDTITRYGKHTLTNVTDGGGGVAGYKPTIEIRNKISKALRGKKYNSAAIEAVRLRKLARRVTAEPVYVQGSLLSLVYPPPANRKLDADQVKAIRSIGRSLPLRDIGKRFGVDKHTISDILIGRIYRNV